MNSMFNVGVTPEVVREARRTILDIIVTNNADSTKQFALEALKTICNVSNTTVRDCSFVVNGDKPQPAVFGEDDDIDLDKYDNEEEDI